MTHDNYFNDAIELLKVLIATPSISGKEEKAADAIIRTVVKYGYPYKCEGNNVWVTDPHYDEQKPTLLLNAHLDTVKPVESWTRPPFSPQVEDGKLYGLGSNDCGGGLVSLLQTFRMLTAKEQKYNIIYLASAEEEISGKNGIEKVLPLLPKIDVAIVGEPTSMRPAIAEKGLMVLDLISTGDAGHVGHSKGRNAIYEMLDDLIWIRDYKFKKNSELLGDTKMNVTVIHAGTQHNVVPDRCTALVDVRINEMYTNKEVFDIIEKNVKCELKAHSFRLNPSCIDIKHPLVKRAIQMHLKPYGSPTLSDQALMPFPSMKLGPGDSLRSHSADEYIEMDEIEKAIDIYFTLLNGAEI